MSGLDAYEQKRGVEKLKNELNDYFKFVSLLEKKRSSKSTQLIEEFTKSESNILQRIHFIEQLDQEEKHAQRIDPQLGEEDTRKAKTIAKKQKKNPIVTSSFLKYLFSGRKAISNFGNRTRIISAGFFSPRMTGDSEHYYKSTLSDATSNLLTAVNFLVENGWEKLDRKSYNVVVAFSKFLRLFIQYGNILKYDDIRLTFKELEMFIQQYLQVASSKVNKEILKEAFYEVLFFDPNFKSRFRDMVSYLNEILNTESRGMCFFNIILGIYTCQFRSFIKLNDVKAHYNIQEIDFSHYDFTSKIIQRIKDKMFGMESKFLKAEKDLFFLRFLEESLDFATEEENPVFQVLAKVYYSDRLMYPKTFLDLQKESEEKVVEFLKNIPSNLSTPIMLFVQGFQQLYGDFLKGDVTFKIKGEKASKEIFREHVFSDELEKLRRLENELRTLKNVNAYLSVSFETYDRFNNTGKTELEKEGKICSIFKNIINVFFSISKKIASILYANFLAQNLKGEEKLSALSYQEEPIEDSDIDARLLPFATHGIYDNPNLEGEMVIDIISDANIFAVNVCLLFRHHVLFDLMGRKHKYITYTEEYLNLKSKVDS